MSSQSSIKKLAFFSAAITLVALMTIMQGCKKKKPEMTQEFFKRTQNKAFQHIPVTEYDSIFQVVYKKRKKQMGHSLFISDFYQKTKYQPVLVLGHLFNNDLNTLSDYIGKSSAHGIDPALFHADSINFLINRIKDKNAIKTPDQACEAIAQLELLSANSLITYSNVMQYGLVSPKQIFSRYFTTTLRPDSASMSKVFHIGDMSTYLDSIQPKDPQYIALQKALADHFVAAGKTEEETKRIILVNMERLRWRNKPTTSRYVIVNIPDYNLDVIDSGKSILNMKVCVGEGRNKGNPNTIVAFNDTCRADRPYVKETPQLSSVITCAEVNPIWNIPQSIANKEIIVEADKDPSYLENKSIDVFKNGHRVDPNTINWANASNEDYDFKQRPGDDNSLGKIKFLFKNNSNVYLHDTPAKRAFGYKVRAVSHGCVRLEKPLDFAHTLFGDGNKYTLIEKDFNENNPEPTTISLRPAVPVFITYYTCWTDNDGQMQIRDDIYGLDIVLYVNLEKYLPKGTQKEQAI